MSGPVDLHNHLIPGVDDGAADLDQAQAALAAMREEGVRGLISTPHFRASSTRKPDVLHGQLEAISSAWELLRSAASEVDGLRVERGVELMLDMPDPDLSDPRLRLAGTSFVLVEFVAMSVPPRSEQAIFELRMSGWTPVIAHPERYSGIRTRFDAVGRWRAAGALLQVNTGSLLGRYGNEAKEVAWELLKRGWVDYLSSDYHARGRLSIRDGRAALEQAGGEEQARLLMEVNPGRLLAGSAPEPVPPLADRPPLWRRMLRMGR